VRVGTKWVEGHVIISADRLITEWAVASAGEIGMEALRQAIDLRPEIILVGTGPDVLLPNVELMRSLAAESIGLETMTTPAAIRTFNVLLNEHRRVVVALFNPR
jgi:uncharacterized protein